MGQVNDVTLDGAGADVTLEVVIGYPRPAGITVALYGSNRQKEKDIGQAFSMTPPDPDVFPIAAQGQVGTLNGKIVGVFVAISSYTGPNNEPYVVTAQLRQGGQVVGKGTIVEQGVATQGGAGVIVGYKLST